MTKVGQAPILARMNKPMSQVNIYEAKTRLSELVARAAKGETIVIAKAGEPVAQLGPIQNERKKIKFGTLKGKIKIAGDFDDPLPESLIDAFEGKTETSS